MGTLLQRHTATVKLATALAFLGIGIWLIYGGSVWASNPMSGLGATCAGSRAVV